MTTTTLTDTMSDNAEHRQLFNITHCQRCLLFDPPRLKINKHLYSATLVQRSLHLLLCFYIDYARIASFWVTHLFWGWWILIIFWHAKCVTERTRQCPQRYLKPTGSWWPNCGMSLALTKIWHSDWHFFTWCTLNIFHIVSYHFQL